MTVGQILRYIDRRNCSRIMFQAETRPILGATIGRFRTIEITSDELLEIQDIPIYAIGVDPHSNMFVIYV